MRIPSAIRSASVTPAAQSTFGVPGMKVASATKIQTSSSGAGIEVQVSCNDAAVRRKYPKFDGLEQIEVRNSITNTWEPARYVGSQGKGQKTVDTHSFRMGPTTQILLAKDIEVAVRARIKVGDNTWATIDLTDPAKKLVVN